VFVAQARARQQHGRERGVPDVHGQAGGDERRCAGLQFQRRIQAGAQVEAGAAGGGIGRQGFGQAGVEQLDVDDGHLGGLGKAVR